MYTFVLTIHIIVTIGLIGLILVQRGRSSGLIEALGGVESIFGTKTNAFFVKLTVFLAVMFFVTSISLAYLDKRKNASLLETVGKQKTMVEETVKKEVSKEQPLQEQNQQEKVPQEQTSKETVPGVEKNSVQTPKVDETQPE